MVKMHVLGFPRIGGRRELKTALESFWRGDCARAELEATCTALKERHWSIQKRSGLSFVSTGDFSLYDQVLDTTAMLGLVPPRYGSTPAAVDDDLYFAMARGDAARDLPAMEMTKWFNTNYHYLVPEIWPEARPTLARRRLVKDTRQAREAGYLPKPVLVGPITYLALAKTYQEGFSRWEKLGAIVEVYAAVLRELGELCPWIQIDEPILCADMESEAREAFLPAYRTLNAAASSARILLTTYFDALDDNLDLALASGCGGLHVDLVQGRPMIDALLERLPEEMVLSAGIVDGRNIWKTDVMQASGLIASIAERIGPERLMLSSSCSLLHVPVDLIHEQALDPQLKRWMSFAVQKCAEIRLLGDMLTGDPPALSPGAHAADVHSRRTGPRVQNEEVRARCRAVGTEMLNRRSPYPRRREAQAWLDLPLLPTTTIGSFPQTGSIRKKRRQFKNSEISAAEYETFLREEIRREIEIQEDLGLDVLVHGEAERNDMVEYFGERLEGFCFTENGWVQSYGSRCVKPPVIFGDVARPAPMTVSLSRYAQSLTRRPVKGMLTGPVTILCWSFVRDDLERSEVCRQIALAVRDEVLDLEAQGIRIIQIDEPALREGLPLKRRHWGDYLGWAVEAFRLATAGVADATQIHTHMCYSEFNAIIASIAALDADVISIESSRSKMELLDTFAVFDYPNAIGPGVYDIHSARVPSQEEIVALLERALTFIPQERLWVNPDCGLKTRDWPETVASLRNMVAAARVLRAARS